jgi:hypothetical protein
MFDDDVADGWIFQQGFEDLSKTNTANIITF